MFHGPAPNTKSSPSSDGMVHGPAHDANPNPSSSDGYGSWACLPFCALQQWYKLFTISSLLS